MATELGTELGTKMPSEIATETATEIAPEIASEALEADQLTPESLTPQLVLGTEAVVHEAEGLHLLLTLSGCSAELLNNEQFLRDLTEQAAKATRATVLRVVSQKFSPQGVTVLAMLAESHASLHTYPESGVVFWDCFTCGDTCKPEASVACLVSALTPQKIQQQLVARAAL